MNDKQSLTLEVGKYYRTRDGKKAYAGYVMAESPFNGSKPLYPVSGWVAGEVMPQCWNFDGSLYGPEDEHKFDLVAEWVEPKRIRGWVNIYPGNRPRQTDVEGFSPKAHAGHVYKTRKQADVAAADKVIRIACIEIDVLEGVGLEGEVA
ncbi:hypothetical protein [Rhizobium leguminosarum]